MNSFWYRKKLLRQLLQKWETASTTYCHTNALAKFYIQWRPFFCLNAASGVPPEDLSACFCYWRHKFTIETTLCNIQYLHNIKMQYNTKNNIIQEVCCSCHCHVAEQQQQQQHTQITFLCFHWNNGYANAPLCCVIRTLPSLFFTKWLE